MIDPSEENKEYFDKMKFASDLKDSNRYKESSDGLMELPYLPNLDPNATEHRYKLEGVPQGDMELGFFFDDTPLAPLGHFDLV